ncbi:Required for meiotic nuclear division protein 1-like protein [Trichoplax sp. H2]|nr:Required for meiotic nuclear division protein 1-like protein [Trichoplax sp. H2]|eukprot:RDD44753.1 Required for meiotic nuclear division protein 1-like protein [Trichoplax sp. H2]
MLPVRVYLAATPGWRTLITVARYTRCCNLRTQPLKDSLTRHSQNMTTSHSRRLCSTVINSDDEAKISDERTINSTRTRVRTHVTQKSQQNKNLDLIEPKKSSVRYFTSYATAERYDLDGLKRYLQGTDGYSLSVLPEDVQDVLHVWVIQREPYHLSDRKEVFLFRHGSSVYWNFESNEIQRFQEIVKKFALQPYNQKLLSTESEQLPYHCVSENSRLRNDTILLNSDKNEETQKLEKLTCSIATALSVKLAIWEVALDKYVSSIQWVPEALREGKKVRMSRNEILQKTGELLSLRYQINLASDLLIIPDFFWDRDNLEQLYINLCTYLDMNGRTKVMNEKLNHCTELAELLRTHLSEKHSLRLEWGIIGLIAIEVFFEILHNLEQIVTFLS